MTDYVPPSREDIAEALFALGADVRWTIGAKEYAFRTKSRRLKTFDQVGAEQQPAFYCVETNERLAKRTREPRQLVQSFSLVVYHQAGAVAEAVPATTNNLIMEAIEAALAPKPTDPGFRDDRNTLGGLVHHVWIEGEVIKDPGDLDKQGLIVVPVKVRHP